MKDRQRAKRDYRRGISWSVRSFSTVIGLSALAGIWPSAVWASPEVEGRVAAPWGVDVSGKNTQTVHRENGWVCLTTKIELQSPGGKTMKKNGNQAIDDASLCQKNVDHLEIFQPKRIIIMGGPASGKGTQCEWISNRYNLVHLSTGELLRDVVKRDREGGIGLVAAQHMDSGKLVPDDIIIQVVKDRLSQPDCREQGWLLDGFPRTRAQAEALTVMGIKPDIFLFLSVPDEFLIERVVGRKTDPVTGKIYHMKFSPPPDGDAEIWGRLVQRSDDTVEKMASRLRQFHENVASVRQCYEDVLVEIDGSGAPAVVADKIRNAINKRQEVSA